MIILKDAEPVGSALDSRANPQPSAACTISNLRKYAAVVEPGRSEYRIVHNLGTQDVIVQTRIVGRIREGGLSVIDGNTVQLTFGGVLNEPMDVVVIG